MKKLIIILCLFLTGCNSEEIKTNISNNDYFISINYPITSNYSLNHFIKKYIIYVEKDFKSNYKKKSELNINYTYKKLSKNIISISIQSIINNKIYKYKTFNYNTKTNNFIKLSDLTPINNNFTNKVNSILKEKDKTIKLINNNYNNFYIDEQYLNILFSKNDFKNYKGALIILNIPLNELDLLINIENNDYVNYYKIKKKKLISNKKMLALTFDDGPSKYTDDILDILSKNNACATFFVVGNKSSFYHKTLLKMVKNGNEIGNHSYSHKLLTGLSDKEFKNDVNMTQESIYKYSGVYPSLFRPTYGGYNDSLISNINLKMILWDIDSNDWKLKNSKKIASRVISLAQNKKIILMHDIHKYDVKAAKIIISKLSKEYNFVTVSELLSAK